MTVDLLGGLTEEQRRVVVARMVRRTFRKGDVVFFEGEAGDTVHLLQQGTVAVQASTPGGDVVTLSVLGPGASFGEHALISSDARRTATVITLEPCETRVLHRADFDDLRSRHPAVDRVLVALLVENLRRTSQHLVEALHMPVEGRVVSRLAELADLRVSRQPTRSSDPIAVPVRQEDLAMLAGTTRPTANKVLQHLAELGIVTLARGRVVVLDLIRLRAMVPSA